MDLEQDSKESKRLLPPTDFGFPFAPYEIQNGFMRALYTALEDRKLGIFESPTGTGKSLSLLCGSLTWLQNREEERLERLKDVLNTFDLHAAEKEAQNAANWILAQSSLRKKKQFMDKTKRELKFLEDLAEKRSKYLRGHSDNTKLQKFTTGSGSKPIKQNGSQGKETEPEENLDLDDLILNDDYAPNTYSDSDCDEEDPEEEPEFYPNKVIFASRTHSQLGQFANELKRTKFAKQITTVSLGSRQNLCINPDVLRLKSLSLINERCLDLQKGSKGKQTSETKKLKGCSGCPYFNYSAIEELKSHILSEPMDIEDLVGTAKTLKACPYYASRKASKEAQLILLPYNTILHSGTRDGVGIKIKNSVVLLDEAHNLIESISNMYSNFITLQQLDECSKALKSYTQRYISRFNAKNLLKLKQVAFVLKGLLQYVGQSSNEDAKVFNIQEFKITIGIDNLDLHDLLQFLRKSKLIFKLKGYIQQQEKIAEKREDLEKPKVDVKEKLPIVSKSNKNKTKKLKESTKTNIKDVPSPTVNKKRSQASQAVLNFCEFFKSLLTVNCEGRIILERQSLKFLLLNTSDHFHDLILSARSIILAGGTMKPYEDIEDQLFLSAKERICHFSCDHVIPDENLVCLALSKGPTSVLFDFTYKSRNSPALMEELSRTIVNLSKMVPGGLVCFLPSYDYEALLYSHLQSSGSKDRIESRKKIFREPKDSNCDLVLTEYSRQIRNSPGGAVLFAVVGGKLSEGINFSDDLGRCVVVVGLPYPNIMGLDIKEKVKFVSERFGQDKGSQLLTNMCSKAVNQSIGRAIRHSSDYASIILLDHRYTRPAQQALLPDWILKRFQPCDNFGQAVKSISSFFSSKNSVKTS